MLVRGWCLCVVLLFGCLHLGCGHPFWWKLLRKLQNPPPSKTSLTIDQVLMESSGGRPLMRGRSMGGGTHKTGLDMQLSEEQYRALFGRGRSHSDEKVIFNPWPLAEIPYVFAPYTFGPERKSKILEAMAVWTAVTCVRFRPKRSGDSNWVTFFSGRGCYSKLGMIKKTGSQPLSLAPTCYWRGTVEHELGHAIGLVHEHQRPERDWYLEVNDGNVPYDYLSELVRYSPGTVTKLGLRYDYLSVMHYGQYAFSYNGRAQTLYAVDPYSKRRLPDVTEKLGKVMGPSFLDVKLVNRMYNCDGHCYNRPRCRPGCFIDKNCRCFCEEDMPPVPCTDHRSDCAERARRGDCNNENSEREMTDFCRRTCGVCAVGNTRLPPENQNTRDCQDKDSNCSSWGAYCKQPYIRQTCPRTCDTC